MKVVAVVVVVVVVELLMNLVAVTSKQRLANLKCFHFRRRKVL